MAKNSLAKICKKCVAKNSWAKFFVEILGARILVGPVLGCLVCPTGWCGVRLSSAQGPPKAVRHPGRIFKQRCFQEALALRDIAVAARGALLCPPRRNRRHGMD